MTLQQISDRRKHNTVDVTPPGSNPLFINLVDRKHEHIQTLLDFIKMKKTNGEETAQ